MQNGSETWKWGVVFVLLAIFLVTANQAYQHVTSQETFAPPDDYLQGDSWDMEHQGGPGAGQPIQMSPESVTASDSQAMQPETEVPEPMVIQEDIDWNKVKDPTGEKL